MMDDLISRQAAIDAYGDWYVEEGTEEGFIGSVKQLLEAFPSAQPPKEIPRRVLWTGWKGHRYTRYECPNCVKPVRNDDTYCHKCGQRLMFPKISFTEYVPGERQDVIVRWDDEG